jgi:hypothetical protein
MDERKVERVTADVWANCQASGDCHNMFALNLSTAGCMLRTSDAGLRLGQRLDLKFTDAILACGHVVWRRHHYIGVQFLGALELEAVKQLGFKVTDDETLTSFAGDERTRIETE